MQSNMIAEMVMDKDGMAWHGIGEEGWEDGLSGVKDETASAFRHLQKLRPMHVTIDAEILPCARMS